MSIQLAFILSLNCIDIPRFNSIICENIVIISLQKHRRRQYIPKHINMHG